MKTRKQYISFFNDIINKENSEGKLSITNETDGCEAKISHQYNPNGYHILSFSCHENRFVGNLRICNSNSAVYFLEGECEGRRVQIEICGKVKSVYRYRNKISFAVEPDEVIVTADNKAIKFAFEEIRTESETIFSDFSK